MDETKITYKDAGVDIDAGNTFVKMIKPLVKATSRPEVLADIGGFGGLFSLNMGKYKHPVLVSGTDGVGTKLKVAFLADRHDTIGIDLVAMCVNDIIVQGAEPLFFLDYLGTGKLEPHVFTDIIKGFARACAENHCALIGGETAQMPGFYQKGEYDVSGTIVGVVEKSRMLNGQKTVKRGDVVIGIESSGLHTNGYSLARKVCFDLEKLGVDDPLPGTSQTVAQALLAIHRSYLKPVLPLVRAHKLVAMAHITGGGLTDNLPRVLPKSLDAEIATTSWVVPALFTFLMEKGGLGINDARQALNLGVGMVLVAKADRADEVLADLHAAEEPAWVLGRLTPGSGVVRYR